MRVTTFYLHDKGIYTRLKSFFDLSIMQLDCFSYVDDKTQESIPTEAHLIYIISKNGSFREVAYEYKKKNDLKLFEAYPDCLKYRTQIADESIRELIKPVFKCFKNTQYLDCFELTKEFEGCSVFGLEYFVRKKPKKVWDFDDKTDEYLFNRIVKERLINN